MRLTWTVTLLDKMFSTDAKRSFIHSSQKIYTHTSIIFVVIWTQFTVMFGAVPCSGAANGSHQNEVKIWPIIVCNAMSPHAYTFIAHLCTLNGLNAAMQNNSPAHYSLSRDPKLFNAKVRRGAIFTSKCTRNCLADGLCPDLLWEFTMLPHTL